MFAGTMQYGRIVLDEVHVGQRRPEGLLHQELGTDEISGRRLRHAKEMQGMQIARVLPDDALVELRGTCDIPLVMQGGRLVQELCLVTHLENSVRVMSAAKPDPVPYFAN